MIVVSYITQSKQDRVSCAKSIDDNLYDDENFLAEVVIRQVQACRAECMLACLKNEGRTAEYE